MADSVQHNKFRAIFDWFDQGQDGWLTQGDLQAMAGRFAGLAKDDPENATAMRDAFDLWWQLLLEHGDSDGDGRISREEFIAVMGENVTTPEHFETAILAIADALMRALDTDGDGALDRTEYVRVYDELGVPPVHSGSAFERLDRDGNGLISHEEWRIAICEFYLSGDPDAPGNWLIGPIDTVL
ncbi:EF-hand domain-containing protein [Streptomyces tsukubensis]|uniref:EF-hand domain-containing protein n=1 Tax=Streptomyces tsukubensis TaxID=83656 RepID=UPI00344E5108